MGGCVSRPSTIDNLEETDGEMKVIKMRFNALAVTRGDGGYILDKDFEQFFKLQGVLRDRLFRIFDEDRDGKIKWDEFKTGVLKCMYGDSVQLDDFIFEFFDTNDDKSVDYAEFRFIFPHIHYSIFQVVMRSASSRSDDAVSWVEQYGNATGELPMEVIQTGIRILARAYFGLEEPKDHDVISKHNFSVFLSEQPKLREFFQYSFNIFSQDVQYNGQTIVAYTNTRMNQSYHYSVNKAIPFSVNSTVNSPDNFYETRKERTPVTRGQIEKGDDCVRVVSCMTCEHCQKRVRYCPMCNGELQHYADKSGSGNGNGNGGEVEKGVKKMQCMKCHHVVAMRYCSNCGYLFKETNVDVCMEAPPSETDLESFAGPLYIQSVFNRMKKRFVCIRDQFMYIYTSDVPDQLKTVVFIEGATVDIIDDESNRQNGYYGFRMQFPAIYNREFYTRSEKDRDEWISHIRETTNVRKIEDYYDIRETIGEGKFAIVKRCVEKKITQREFAVKILNKKNMAQREKELDFVRREIAILKLVHHHNIVELVDTFENENNIYIVMELLRGDLYDYLNGRSLMSEEVVFKLIEQLADCLCYLHRKGIIHRDIKPENILCKDHDTMDNLKIGDFGLSRHVFPDEKLDFKCGTLNYIAPEVLGKQGYTTKADMWSVGIIMYLVLCGTLPFEGKRQEDIVNAILYLEPNYHNTKIISLSYNCREVLKGLLQKNPDKRLSAEELLQHPWFIDMRNRRKTRPYKPKQTVSARYLAMEVAKHDDLEEEVRREQEEKARMFEAKRAQMQQARMKRQEWVRVVSPRDLSPRSQEAERKRRMMMMAEEEEEEEQQRRQSLQHSKEEEAIVIVGFGEENTEMKVEEDHSVKEEVKERVEEKAE